MKNNENNSSSNEIKNPTISFFKNPNIPPEDYSRYFQYHSLIISKTEQIEQDPQIKKNFLNKYFTLEEELTLEVNTIKNNKNHKRILRETLYKQFFEHDAVNRLHIQKNINKYFNRYLTSLNMQRDFKKDFQLNFDDNDFNKNDYENVKLKAFLKEMKHGIIDECISYIMTKLPKIDQIPNFLINKSLIKQKVNLIWKINYSIPANQLKMEQLYAYKYLTKKYNELYEENATLFHLDIYNKDNLLLLIEMLFLTNIDYIQSDTKVRKVFLERLSYYLLNMHLDNMYDELKNGFISKLNEKLLNVENEMESKFSLLKHNLTLNSNVNFEEEGNEKILNVIFCFTLMLNNTVIIIEKDKQYSVIPNKKLICSSIERKFLFNMLNAIDRFLILNNEKSVTNSSIFVNMCIENSILNNYFRLFCASLLDVTVVNKIEFDQNTLINKITQSFKINKNNYIKDQFNSFMNKYNEKTKSFFGKEKIHFVNARLIPNDPQKITNHITIVVSKKYDTAILNQLNSNNKNIDYYFYNWNNSKNENDKSILEKFSDLISINSKKNEMKKTSLTFAGNFLAYLLLTRAVFSFQTISLIGIGNGCEIIIRCIETIFALNQEIDLISDILFVNGKLSITDTMLVQINSVITGNVYNVYSSLKSRQNQDDEHKKFVLRRNEIVYDRWKNLDVCDLHLESTGYKYHINDIIEKLNFQ